MLRRRPIQLALITIALLTAVGSFALLRGCHANQRLVEQFDNGPIRGKPGPSEGYFWVGPDDHPSAGKHWKPTDPATLTPEQRQRIH
jgi:hypothetical protein